MDIQLVLLVGVPCLLIYTAMIFSYGYREGHKAGLEIAELIAQDQEESEE